MLYIIYHHNHASSQSPAREKRCCQRQNTIRFGEKKRAGTSSQTEFGAPRSTLNDRARGRILRQLAHEGEQVLPPAMERVLEVWAQKIGDHEFPPRLVSFKAMARERAERNAEQMGSYACETWEDLAAEVSQPSP